MNFTHPAMSDELFEEAMEVTRDVRDFVQRVTKAGIEGMTIGLIDDGKLAYERVKNLALTADEAPMSWRLDLIDQTATAYMRLILYGWILEAESGEIAAMAAEIMGQGRDQ